MGNNIKQKNYFSFFSEILGLMFSNVLGFCLVELLQQKKTEPVLYRFCSVLVGFMVV